MLLRKIATGLSAITLVSCNTVPIVQGCSELARGVLTTPTPYPAISADTDPSLYGLEATGQITKANDKAVTGFQIINACEVRDESVRRSLRPWYQRLF